MVSISAGAPRDDLTAQAIYLSSDNECQIDLPPLYQPTAMREILSVNCPRNWVIVTFGEDGIPGFHPVLRHSFRGMNIFELPARWRLAFSTSRLAPY